MSESVKIVFVTTSDLSGTSGHNVATKEIARAFANNDAIELTLVCPRPERTLPDDLDGISSHHFWSRPEGSPHERVREQASLYRLLRRILRADDVDALVARHSPTLLAPTLLARRHGLHYTLLVRGLSYKRLRFPRLLQRFFDFNVRNADEVIVAYQEIESDAIAVRSSEQSDPIVFPNAVDPSMFSPRSRVRSRERISSTNPDLDDARFVVGFVGSLKDRHHVRELLEAAGSADVPGLAVLVVGDGPNEERLRDVALDLDVTIIFTGFVGHRDVPTYVASCDLCYGVVDPDVPSNPIKCYEYLSCERPILTSRAPELEFVERHDVGFVVDEIAPDAIAEAIESAADRPRSELEGMGERGRDYVVEHHSWDRLPETILARIEDSASNQGR